MVSITDLPIQNPDLFTLAHQAVSSGILISLRNPWEILTVVGSNN